MLQHFCKKFVILIPRAHRVIEIITRWISRNFHACCKWLAIVKKAYLTNISGPKLLLLVCTVYQEKHIHSICQPAAIHTSGPLTIDTDQRSCGLPGGHISRPGHPQMPAKLISTQQPHERPDYCLLTPWVR